jgi:hypothetical protein
MWFILLGTEERMEKNRYKNKEGKIKARAIKRKVKL